MDFYDRSNKKNSSPSGSALSPVDYFMHPSIQSNSDQVFRARVLITSQFAIIVFSVLTIIFLMVAPVPTISRQMGLPVCFAFIGACLPLLVKLKRQGNFRFCSQLTVWLLVVPITFGIFVSGGMAESPVASMLAGPPLIMAYFFGGMRVGLFVTVVSFVLIFVGLAVDHNGAISIQVYTDEQRPIANSVFYANTLLTNTVLAFLYESVSSAARNSRDREHRKIISLAQTDTLTGLLNRRRFDEKFATRVAAFDAGQNINSFAFCSLDLNGFKQINDRHGHYVGDQVLRAIAIRLCSALRGTDLIGRQGGDEFVLLLEGLEPGPQLELLANRFVKIVADPIETNAGLLSVGGSFGFAFFGLHGDDTESLKQAADAAMYLAKRGQHGWRVYDASAKLEMSRGTSLNGH